MRLLSFASLIGAVLYGVGLVSYLESTKPEARVEVEAVNCIEKCVYGPAAEAAKVLWRASSLAMYAAFVLLTIVSTAVIIKNLGAYSPVVTYSFSGEF